MTHSSDSISRSQQPSVTTIRSGIAISCWIVGRSEIAAAHARVWRHAIEPLLREYFHTRPNAGSLIEQLRVSFFQEPVMLDELDIGVETEA